MPIKLTRLRCKCGGDFPDSENAVKNGVVRCSNCNALWHIEILQDWQNEQFEKMRSVFEEALFDQKETQVANIRHMLWAAAFSDEYLCREDIKDAANELDRLLRDDFEARLYKKLLDDDNREVIKFLSSITAENWSVYYDHIVNLACKVIEKKEVFEALESVFEKYADPDDFGYEDLKRSLDNTARRIQGDEHNVFLKRDVFVSFDTRDLAAVEEIVAEIEKRHKCFVSYRNLPNDKGNFWVNIDHAIHNCKTFLLISSVNSRNNSNVHRELDMWKSAKSPRYLDRNCNLLMTEYLLDRYPPDKSRYTDGDRTVLDYFSGNPWKDNFQALVDRVHDYCIKHDTIETEILAGYNPNLVKDIHYCRKCLMPSPKDYGHCGRCGGTEFVDSIDVIISEKERELKEQEEKMLLSAAQIAEQEKEIKELEAAKRAAEIEVLSTTKDNEALTAKIAELEARQTIESLKKSSEAVYTEKTSEPAEFEIVDGVLMKYLGRNKNVVIPDGVKKIGEGAFEELDFIESVEMPDTVVAIGCSAFEGCVNLRRVKLSNRLKKIGASAFAYCVKLKYITLPQSLKHIYEFAFDGCRSLGKLEIPDGLESFGASRFEEWEIERGLKEDPSAAGHGKVFSSSVAVPRIPAKFKERYKRDKIKTDLIVANRRYKLRIAYYVSWVVSLITGIISLILACTGTDWEVFVLDKAFLIPACVLAGIAIVSGWGCSLWPGIPSGVMDIVYEYSKCLIPEDMKHRKGIIAALKIAAPILFVAGIVLIILGWVLEISAMFYSGYVVFALAVICYIFLHGFIMTLSYGVILFGEFIGAAAIGVIIGICV